MSITSEEGIRLAAELGCSRVILARELSLDEIGKIRSQTELPLEVFVHGALCVAYSGQCLTSEALGGRSANRGECAQACRMPYEIVCDGQPVDLGKTQYLLSPQDLAAYDLIPRLIELGVASLKIEGRLKSPEYVANITRHYRQAIDAAWAGQPVEFTPRDVEEMELSFSRGFSHGFLDGNDHKVLVRGDYAKKRGIFLGRVESRDRRASSLLLHDRQAGRRRGLRRRRVGRRSRTGRPGLRGPAGTVRPASSSGSAATRSTWAAPAWPGRLEDRRSRARPPASADRSKVRRPGSVDLDLEVHAEVGPPLRGRGPDSDRASRAACKATLRSRRPDPSPPTLLCCGTSSAGWAARSTGSAT